ncbi:MAG: SGNH/GDSL hydrolase family protein [Pseudomonadota bacterium]
MNLRRAVLLVCLLGATLEGQAEETRERYAYVIGASVSTGFNFFRPGYSPSLYALEKLGFPRERVVKKTVITGSFRRKYRWLQRKFQTHPPALIIGIDLFHHDLRKKPKVPRGVYAYAERMLNLLNTSGADVIVGYTWTRYNNRPTINTFNRYLNDQQHNYPNLAFFPVPGVYDALMGNTDPFRYNLDGVAIDISKRLRPKLLLDIVHPNDRGARVFANLLIDIANRSFGRRASFYDVTDVAAIARRVNR